MSLRWVPRHPALPAPTAVLAATEFGAGFAVAFFDVMLITTLQEQVPEDKLSRVLAYDSMGSMALRPLGLAIAGPLTVWLGPEVRTIRSGGSDDPAGALAMETP